MRRRTVLAAAVGLVTVPAAVIEPTRAHVVTGSYIALNGLTVAQARQKRAQQLGRTDHIVSNYYDWNDPLPSSTAGIPDDAMLMISWGVTTYAKVLNGSQDALIRAAANALRAYRKPVLVRFAWEMNGWWFTWGGTKNPTGTAGFIEVWRRVHDIFFAAGATNVSWVWCVNWNNNPDRADNAGGRYYPGDAYVDWIAVDGFSDSGETPEQLFGAFYREYGGRKPLMIAETAVTKPDGPAVNRPAGLRPTPGVRRPASGGRSR